MKYVYTELEKFQKNKMSYWEKLNFSQEYYMYMLMFSFFKIYNNVRNFFTKTKKEKEDEQNVEKVFEYLH